jgi:acetyl-CoA carboxylase biotin carboxyl carrier protein
MSKSDKSPQSPTVDGDLVRQLAQLLEETGLNEIEYGQDDWHIRVSGGKTIVAAGPVATQAAGPAPVTADGSDDEDLSNYPGMITSPMVGVVYTSSDPDTPAFVKVGDTVEAGDTLLLIEAMKVFNPIRAAKAGKVTRILVNSGMPVEFGEPLMIVE